MMPDLPVSSAQELEAMVQSLSTISTDLLESYDRLEQRAEHVEQELCRANAELEHRVAEVEAILHALPVGVVVRDSKQTVVRINGALERILGRSPEELQGRPGPEVLPLPSDTGETIDYQCPDGAHRVLASRTRCAPSGHW